MNVKLNFLLFIFYCNIGNNIAVNEIEISFDELQLKYKYTNNCYSRHKLYKDVYSYSNITLNKIKKYDPAIVINNLIDDIDSYNIIALANCVQKFFPNHSYSREFEESYGGNNVTFINDLLYYNIPELFEHIYNTTDYILEYLHWRPNVKQLGLRVVELLEYTKGGELSWHSDTDSIYTLVIMLSNPNDFKGGEFVIIPRHSASPDYVFTEDDILNYAPQEFGAMLFDSEASHGVTEIIEGKRIVLAIEFWPFQSTNMTHMRPPPHPSLGYLVPSFYIQDINIPTQETFNIPDGYVIKNNNSLRIEYLCIFLCGIVIGILYDLLINIYAYNESKKIKKLNEKVNNINDNVLVNDSISSNGISVDHDNKKKK